MNLEIEENIVHNGEEMSDYKGIQNVERKEYNTKKVSVVRLHRKNCHTLSFASHTVGP